MTNLAAPLGRLFMALIFILSGAGKLASPAGAGAYMHQAGLPAALAIPAGLFEVLAGLAIVLGWQTRIVAILLAGFCLLTAGLFHGHFADQMQMVMAMKNLAMAGGFLMLFAHGAGAMSLDARQGR